MRTKHALKALEMLINEMNNKEHGFGKRALRRLKEENYTIYHLIKSGSLDSRVRKDIEEIEREDEVK